MSSIEDSFIQIVIVAMCFVLLPLVSISVTFVPTGWSAETRGSFFPCFAVLVSSKSEPFFKAGLSIRAIPGSPSSSVVSSSVGSISWSSFRPLPFFFFFPAAKDAGTFSSFSSINRPLAMLFPRGTFIGFIVSLLGGCSLSKLCSPPFSGFSTSFGPPLS